MPVITFDKQHLDEGFMFLAKRGEVGCLPDDVFVITDTLFELLKQSDVPFTQVENDLRGLADSLHCRGRPNRS